MKVAYFLGTLNRGGMETLLLDVFRQSREVSYQMMCLQGRWSIVGELCISWNFHV